MLLGSVNSGEEFSRNGERTAFSHLTDLDKVWRIILNWISENCILKIWTGLR